jgi:hypothetical protein
MELGFFKALQQEWPTLSAAPWSAVIIAVISWSVGFGCAKLFYGGTLSTLRERLQLYQDRLQGASPDEAKAKIEDLQRTIQDLQGTVKSTIGAKWEPLTNDEIISLSANVNALEKRRIQIMYGNQLGKDMAQSISDAFTKAGWPVIFCEGGGLGIGVSTGPGNGMAYILKQAIEATTKLKVALVRPEEPDIPDIVFVAVGINPN